MLRAVARFLDRGLNMPTVTELISGTKERWRNRKCLDYCQVAEHCLYGQKVKSGLAKHLKGVS